MYILSYTMAMHLATSWAIKWQMLFNVKCSILQLSSDNITKVYFIFYIRRAPQD